MKEDNTKKPGRKRLSVDRRRNQRIPVKLSVPELEEVKRKARECGLAVATFAHHAVVGAKLSPSLSAEELRMIKSLYGIANNLNQIARNSNIGIATKKEILEIILVIEDIIEKIK